ncbi:hypothetical protein [Variovorax saccharolyticus]|uniref:hypothetical protein n=1 Tax=Variovorax saccharolyticus TaxID=3053516 RepID=UPI002578F934|nr:hypothetical protein [Variovorax sp. J22R187]MDM0022122.1 hypothetical protein [Variovorax sp. J22R187]
MLLDVSAVKLSSGRMLQASPAIDRPVASRLIRIAAVNDAASSSASGKAAAELRRPQKYSTLMGVTRLDLDSPKLASFRNQQIDLVPGRIAEKVHLSRVPG